MLCIRIIRFGHRIVSLIHNVLFDGPVTTLDHSSRYCPDAHCKYYPSPSVGRHLSPGNLEQVTARSLAVQHGVTFSIVVEELAVQAFLYHKVLVLNLLKVPRSDFQRPIYPIYTRDV